MGVDPHCERSGACRGQGPRSCCHRLLRRGRASKSGTPGRVAERAACRTHPPGRRRGNRKLRRMECDEVVGDLGCELRVDNDGAAMIHAVEAQEGDLDGGKVVEADRETFVPGFASHRRPGLGRKRGMARRICRRLRLSEADPHPVRQAFEGLCLELVGQRLAHELHREVLGRRYSKGTARGFEASLPVTDEKPRNLSRMLLWLPPRRSAAPGVGRRASRATGLVDPPHHSAGTRR